MDLHPFGGVCEVIRWPTLHLLSVPGCMKSIVSGAQTQSSGTSGDTLGYPFQNSTAYEKSVGDLSSAYSRRINIQHGLVYQVLETNRMVKVLRMWRLCEWWRVRAGIHTLK